MHRDNRTALILFVLLALIAVLPAASTKAASLDYVASTLWSGVNDLVCRDTLVFAAYQYGLQVLDIADPASPKIVSQLYLPPGGYVGIAVQEEFAFLAAGASGVAIVDISNPTAPHLVSWQDTPGSASALLARGDYLYVTDTWAGLEVINVADPSAPSIKGSYDTPGDARGLALYGDYVLVADGYDGGLQVINVAIPEIPYPAGQTNTEGIAKRVVVKDHYAYVADADGGAVIVDISDPTQPVKKSSFPQSTTHRYAEDVAVSNGVLYLIAGYLQVVDVADLENPQLIDTLHEAGYSMRVIESGGRLFTLYPMRGICILDIQTANAPVILGKYEVAGDVDRVAARDSILVVGCDSSVYLINVADPESPVEISNVPAMISCRGVAIADSYAYFADADSGTHVVDISNPALPAEANRLNATSSDWEVSAGSGYLCISSASTGTAFYRMDDPVHPTPIGNYLAAYNARAACDGALGYIAAGYGGLQVINLVDSTTPFREGRLQIYGAFNDLVLDSPYAYIAHESAGLVVADISNPTLPHEVGRFDGFPGRPNSTGIAVSGKTAFLTAAASGVWAIDISNPVRPTPIAANFTLGEATRVAVSDDYVYVADLFGLTILRFNQPTDVEEREASDLPAGIHLAQNHPNPFNPSTTISYDLPGRAYVRLTIYNLLGQEVAVLVDDVQTAGSHDVEWNGTDRHGKPVATGVYLYSLSAGEKKVSRKMLLLK